MNKITISAIVTGFPPGLRPPKPLPGETLAQLVIRNHPQEWHNCVEQLKKKFQVPEEVCSRLRRGEISAAVDPAVQREIEWFMNLRVPTHGRTFQGLSEIREQMLKPGGLKQLWQLQLIEIIWPRQKNLSGDTEAEKFAASLGVTMVSIDTENTGPMDFGYLFKQIRGEYLWILPGGSLLSGPMTVSALIRVFREFQENPKMALYSDQCYCMIYRTSALRALVASGKTLSAELRDNGRMLQEAGFELLTDNDPIHGLVEIESFYGGQHDPFSQMGSSRGIPSRSGRTSWWRRLLGLE